MTGRVYNDYIVNFGAEDDEDGDTTKYRKSGAGRQRKAPGVRYAAIDWFLDVRSSLKDRLPRKLFLTKCRELYNVWLEQ